MKTKEYLSQYLKAKRYAEKCFEKLDELDIGPRSPKMDGMPRASGISDLADTVAQRERIRKKWEAAQKRALDLAEEISEVIEAVPDLDERTLLRLRYINGLKWDKVADKMSYSLPQIFRIHGCALISAGELREDESK